MDSDTNTDIEVTNGKVTDTGTRNVLLAISAPGLYEYTDINEFKSLNKVTITYNTTDFEINDIYITDRIVSEVNIGTVWYTIDELLVNGK